MTTTTRTAPLAELLIWQPAATTPPDDETMVMMNHSPMAASEPTWPGYLSTEADTWRCADGQPFPPPSYWADMPAGPDPITTPTAADNLLDIARQLVAHAASVGLVLTVEQRALQPFAQGHFETVVSVREVRRS
jgi:hypothetical protein